MEFFTYALAKLGSSAARLDPKKQGRCMAEVFGAFGWHEGLREMKWIADHMLVRGINWFTPHAFSMAPFPDWDCPPHFYAHGNNPQWPHFGQLMSYMNRTATLLSGGSATRPVAILYHADAEWAGSAMPIERVAAELTRAQIDFDFVPAEAFEDEDRYEVSIADGMLTVNDCRYQAFVMPGASFIGSATARAVRRMMDAGVMALAVDEVPSALYDADGVVELGELAATPLADMAGVLASVGLQTVVTDTPQPWLRALRYEHAGETYVMLVSDRDCMVKLSKKRLDMVKGWEEIEAAKENETVMEGFVTEDNKGGVVVSVKGVRVFVPASQTGLPRETPMSELVKQKVRLIITEVNRARRRVVGSISRVTRAERAAAAEKVWAEIEEGKHYTGTVKSLTSYGAFVDIGGVDGMVHISQIA